jgi:hypothetical protein
VQKKNDKEETIESKSELTYNFIIAIWRSVIILQGSRFIEIVELPYLEILDLFKFDENYLTNFFNVNFYKNMKHLDSLIPGKKSQEELKEEQKSAENVLGIEEVKEQNKKKKSKKDEYKIDKTISVASCFCCFKYVKPTYKFLHNSIGYFRVIIFFLHQYLVIFDYIDNRVCFLDMNQFENVFINESRLMIIIHLITEEYKEEKLVLFTEIVGTDEFQIFNKIYRHFIEFIK